MGLGRGGARLRFTAEGRGTSRPSGTQGRARATLDGVYTARGARRDRPTGERVKASARIGFRAFVVRRIANQEGRATTPIGFTATAWDGELPPVFGTASAAPRFTAGMRQGRPPSGTGRAGVRLRFGAAIDLSDLRWWRNVWRMEQTRYRQREAVRTWQQLETEAIARALKRKGVGRRRWLTGDEFRAIRDARERVEPVAESVDQAEAVFEAGEEGPPLEPHVPGRPGRPRNRPAPVRSDRERVPQAPRRSR